MRQTGRNAATHAEEAEPRPQAEDQLPQPLVWMPSLESGNSQLDVEHRTLIGQCNELTALAVGVDREAFEASLSALAASLARHFESEEALLRATGFDRLDTHIREHCRILMQMQEIQGRAAVAGSKSARADIVRETRELLLDVLLRHDLDYKSHVLFSRGGRARKDDAGS